MIFLTVGTMYTYDRLLKIVDNAISKGIITDQVFGQIGNTNYKPQNFEYVKTLSRDKYIKCFTKADAIISHAGIGTIIMALECNKSLLVVPRLSKFNEHVNDHQVGTSQAFFKKGALLVANDEAEFVKVFPSLETFRSSYVGHQRENLVQFLREKIYLPKFQFGSASR